MIPHMKQSDSVSSTERRVALYNGEVRSLAKKQAFEFSP